MDERTHIASCVAALTKKYHLDPDRIQERDFEFISQKVSASTKVELSTATLRRIWTGKYQSTPQIKTLDALAETLGYQGWHTFKIAKHHAHQPSRISTKKQYLWLLILPFLVGFVWSYAHLQPSQATGVLLFQPETIIREGVPSTIGFHYDIREIKGEISIQLSWNPNERSLLDPQKQFYTGTYFYPDYHEARLFKGEEEMALRKIHITTPGWHGLIMREGLDPNPVLLHQSDFLQGGSMTISSNLANVKGIIQHEPFFPVFTISNEALDSLSVDQLSLQFSAQLLPVEAPQNCRSLSILIKGANDRIRIPIFEEGCYGLFNLSVGDHDISGKTTDLSRLSTDLSKNTPIFIYTGEQTLTIAVGEKESFSVNYPNSLGPLKVIKFIASGPCTINSARLGIHQSALTPGETAL